MTDDEQRRRPPRFIAGAVCPSCGAMDRTVLEQDPEGNERRRCVSCGFSDTAVPGSAPPPGTRFSKSPEERARGAKVVRADAVRILPAQAMPAKPEKDPEDGS